jgi:hypothetical protein
MAWTEGAGIERDVAAEPGRTGAIINGSFVDLEPGLNLVDSALGLARGAGYGKFRVYLNGEEMEPEDAPEFIENGDILKITAFDVAG